MKLSVCVSVKNRSKIPYGNKILTLFPNCIESLVKAVEKLDSSTELIVCDHYSDDWPLEDWLFNAASTVSPTLIYQGGDYSKGRGLNLAAERASGRSLFFMDADMLVDSTLLQRGLDLVSKGKLYFPICRDLDDAGEPGGWREHGYGNLFVTRKIYFELGGFPEFNSWGGEDDIFWDRARKKTDVVRERHRGFFHQWHPEQLRHQYYRNPKRYDQRRHQKKQMNLNKR